MEAMLGVDSLTDDMVGAAAGGSGEDAGRVIASLENQVRAMTIVRLAPSPAQWHAVDDLVQQSLAAIADGLPTLRQSDLAGLRSFASAVISNKVRDFLREDAGDPKR